MEEVKKQGMESLFVPYEIALVLRELGFDKPCLGYYFGKDKQVYTSNEDVKPPFMPSLDSKVMFRAPLYQQAFRFFREKYGLIGFISFNEKSTFRIETLPHSNIKLNSYKEKYFDNNGELWNTYEEAELACLIKLIEIVKTK